MSVNIKYKNNSIATLTDTGTKTLKTSGKYCEADIIVENTKDGGGSGTDGLFHAEVTPATGGKVLTFEVGEIGERIAGVIVSLKPGTSIEVNKNYAVSCIAAANGKQVNDKPSLTNVILYQHGSYLDDTTTSAAQYSNSTPSGQYSYSSYNVWNSTSAKPWVKFYVTNGAESKYGLLVGKTYDIWVIKD